MTETTTKRAETRRFAFTKERLARLTVAAGKAEAWVFDVKSPWLGYRLTANGVGAFYVFRRIKGQPAKVRLGGQEITIEEARALADEVNVQIARGIDPREQRRQDRANSATLGDLVEHFIETHSKPHKKSWAEDESMVRLYLADWKPRGRPQSPARISGHFMRRSERRRGSMRQIVCYPFSMRRMRGPAICGRESTPFTASPNSGRNHGTGF